MFERSGLPTDRSIHQHQPGGWFGKLHHVLELPVLRVRFLEALVPIAGLDSRNGRAAVLHSSNLGGAAEIVSKL